ncbi:MAG: helicase HerA domain-containing protein [Hyphomicrobiaceae bacterium]
MTELAAAPQLAPNATPDGSIGRIVSVTGSKAIVLLDSHQNGQMLKLSERPEMGTLMAIPQSETTVLAIVSALSVPVPAQGDNDVEIWIAELGLVGELRSSEDGLSAAFNRGVTVYPSLGDRVRVASTKELEFAFCGDMQGSVRVGGIRQDANIPAMVRVDDLLGKHFAILGTTGTGKSCTTALILRSILEKNPNAHIVLLDPHNEYATAFKEWGEVISPRNMQLPYWLLNFEELTEVLLGNSDGKKTETEILQELIPLAKMNYGSGRNAKDGPNQLRRSADQGRYTVDTPVPYRMSDVLAMIDERMGRLENKKDLHPYRQLKQRIEMISQDGRYAFMFGQLTVYDGMAQILGRIFRVPVNDKPITILELTGLPSEIINVVVSVLCRMTFDFALWGEGHIPVTLVCEEAHRYVPANPDSGFEPCRRAIAKIAKEGRKYGASLCIVTQRPAEIDSTILSQCNTVFALRMSNDRDQQIVQSAVSDTGSGLLEFLPALGQREAIAFGDGVTLPVRLRFDMLPPNALPRSSTARFSEKWQSSLGDEEFLSSLVERWRTSGGGATGEGLDQNGMLADAMGLPAKEPVAEPVPNGVAQQMADARAQLRRSAAPPADVQQSRAGAVRREPQAPVGGEGAAPPQPLRRREPAAAQATRESADAGANDAMRSIRERLLQRKR